MWRAFPQYPPYGGAYDDVVPHLTCRTAMLPAGKVMLIETVIPEGTAGSDATRVDTTMLVFTGSRERTESEYRDLLQRTRLTLVKTTPTATPLSILEARPDGQS